MNAIAAPYAALFSLHQYITHDGSFDYEKYKEVQTAGNKLKLKHVWASEQNISFLSTYIKSQKITPTFGLCHGTRRGKEQEWFAKYLKCRVLGTEISDTASQFPNTIQWDFHKVKPEWKGNVDFIYSNSFDHTYNPEKCLTAWMSCLSKNGICIIEHTSVDETSTELDPFGASIYVLPFLILLWSRGKFCVKDILDAPAKQNFLTYSQFLILQNN